MMNDFLPKPHWRTEQVIKAPYRVEQHKEEQKKDELILPGETQKPHDPFWKTRVFSIQHIRDCQEGKQFSWLWTPMAEVFNLAQIMFIVLPVSSYLNSHGNNISLSGLILLVLSLQIGLSGGKKVLTWYNEWRFRRTPYRVVRHG